MSRGVGRVSIWSAVLMTALSCANLAAAADSPPVPMVDPQWQQQNDAQGTMWMFNQQSGMQVNGGQNLLMQVGQLTINGQQFQPQRTQMTPDGSEYVYEGFVNNPNGGNAVQTTRRCKLDLATGSVRFVESFQNTSPTPLLISVAIMSPMRMTVRTAVCGPSGTNLDTGTGGAAVAIVGGARVVRSANVRLDMPEKDCAIAFADMNNNYPAAFFYLPGTPNAKPAIDFQSMRVVRVNFNLTVPPQSTVSVVWGVGRSNGQGVPGAQEMKDKIKFFQDRQWLAGLPDAVKKSIINLRSEMPSAGPGVGPLLQPVIELAAKLNIQRGKADVLVQDEQLRLTGTVGSGSLTVNSTFGKVALPLSDVALLCGGGGIDRQMRVYLRNGEILAGRIESKDLVLKAQGGVEAKLPPEKVNMLFLHTAANDGKAPPEASAILLTHDGQRLMVSGSGTAFHALSPWGELDIDQGEIVSLSCRREPQPLYRVALRDGSEFSVVLQGEAPTAKTLRFGPVNLAAVGLRQMSSLNPPKPVKKPADDDASPSLPGPYCRLIGDNLLAGTIDTPQLTLTTAGGALGLAVSSIQTAQRAGEPKTSSTFNVELTNGRRVAGTLGNRTLSLRFHGRTWEIPGQHVLGFAGGPKPAPVEEKPEPGADDSKPAEKEGSSSEPTAPPTTPAPADGDPFGMAPTLTPAPVAAPLPPSSGPMYLPAPSHYGPPITITTSGS